MCRHWLATLTQVHALVAQYDANTEQPCKTATFGNTLRRGNTNVVRRAKPRQHFLPFALTLDKIDLQFPKYLALRLYQHNKLKDTKLAFISELEVCTYSKLQPF